MALCTLQFLLLFIFIQGAKAQTITLLKFEPSFKCSNDFLVENEDYIFFEYEFTGGSSTYGHDAFTGPKIYHTIASSTVLHNPCNVFEVVNPICQDKLGVPFQCSCFELTAGSHYRTEFNMTALVDFSRESVWLQWPGPPPINSENTTLPEIRDACPATGKDRDFDKWVVPVLFCVNVAVLISVVIFLKFCAEMGSTIKMALPIIFALAFLIAFVIILAVCSDFLENWETGLAIVAIILDGIHVLMIIIFVKGYRVLPCYQAHTATKTHSVENGKELSADQVEGVMGGEVSLPCQLDSNLTPSAVTWSKGGKQLDLTSTAKYGEGTVKEPSLRIFGLDKSDAGSYTYSVSFGKGKEESRKINLRVTDKQTNAQDGDGNDGDGAPSKNHAR
ncbi:hypothetical protein EGW08_019486 [Elysia chlorotica]|uniref:Ig-like domain-containing protein n=1 Tax=Elysia chlorotica TaxID=188477 RepID=A0A3S1B000_ELYCH|nr:hypothetical protein EGW08_019486 [Elysia chlorotica]